MIDISSSGLVILDGIGGVGILLAGESLRSQARV